MAERFLAGELTVPSAPRHRSYVMDALERLPADTVIMRLTCDTPAEELLAPRSFEPKGLFIHRLRREMRRLGRRQGGNAGD